MTEVLPDVPKGLYERTADSFESSARRWGRDSFYDYHNDSFCLIGALADEAGRLNGEPRYAIPADGFSDSAAIRKLETLLPEGLPSVFPGDKIIYWNDDRRRTKRDVIDVLRKAAANFPEVQ